MKIRGFLKIEGTLPERWNYPRDIEALRAKHFKSCRITMHYYTTVGQIEHVNDNNDGTISLTGYLHFDISYSQVSASFSVVTEAHKVINVFVNIEDTHVTDFPFLGQITSKEPFDVMNIKHIENYVLDVDDDVKIIGREFAIEDIQIDKGRLVSRSRSSIVYQPWYRNATITWLLIKLLTKDLRRFIAKMIWHNECWTKTITFEYAAIPNLLVVTKNAKFIVRK